MRIEYVIRTRAAGATDAKAYPEPLATGEVGGSYVTITPVATNSDFVKVGTKEYLANQDAHIPIYADGIRLPSEWTTFYLKEGESLYLGPTGYSSTTNSARVIYHNTETIVKSQQQEQNKFPLKFSGIIEQ